MTRTKDQRDCNGLKAINGNAGSNQGRPVTRLPFEKQIPDTVAQRPRPVNMIKTQEVVFASSNFP